MKKSTKLLRIICLVPFFAIFSLAATAEQQTNQQQPTNKPAQKITPVQPKPGSMPGRQIGGQQSLKPAYGPAVQQPNRVGVQQPNRPVLQNPNRTVQTNGVVPPRRTVVVGSNGYRFARPGIRRDVHTFNQQERAVWQRGRWHHERRFGRDGWWWEVNGAWYWYPQAMQGPPLYVSDVEMVDAVAAPTPPDEVEYADEPPPPPPPPSQAVGGAIGGAILGGILGGAISGRAGGAAAGALIGGATGAAIGAEAERRNGFYWWQGGCYYQYPSGEYVRVAPGNCY